VQQLIKESRGRLRKRPQAKRGIPPNATSRPGG
jgi:hypothetical protein